MIRCLERIHFNSSNASSPKKSWFQKLFKSVKHGEITYMYLYGNAKLVAITSRIFINIFQDVHFAAIKFIRSNENNKLSPDQKKNLRCFWKQSAFKLKVPAETRVSLYW